MTRLSHLFNGTGTLFRENGTKLYSGEFANGFQEGNGILYDGSENQIFQGTFHKNEIVYSRFLDKTANEISELYQGDQKIYQQSDQYIVALEDIDVFYVSQMDEESLEDEIKSNSIYVAKSSIVYGTEQISEISALKSI